MTRFPAASDTGPRPAWLLAVALLASAGCHAGHHASEPPKINSAVPTKTITGPSPPTTGLGAGGISYTVSGLSGQDAAQLGAAAYASAPAAAVLTVGPPLVVAIAYGSCGQPGRLTISYDHAADRVVVAVHGATALLPASNGCGGVVQLQRIAITGITAGAHQQVTITQD